MMNAAQKVKSPSLGEVTGAAALVIGVITAWLYFAGWTYAYHYFDRFGIPILMLDIPKENYLVYGGVVFMQFPIWELAMALIILVGAGLWVWLRLDAGRWKIPLAALALFGLFWMGHQAAIAAAHEQYVQQRESDYSAYPRVQLWRKESNKPLESSPWVTNDSISGCYRLLLHNQDRLFLLRPIKGAAAADLPIIIAAWGQIELVRVLPDYTSCE